MSVVDRRLAPRTRQASPQAEIPVALFCSRGSTASSAGCAPARRPLTSTPISRRSIRSSSSLPASRRAGGCHERHHTRHERQREGPQRSATVQTQSPPPGALNMSERRYSDVDANTQFALPLVDPLEPRVLPQDGARGSPSPAAVRDGSMKQRPLSAAADSRPCARDRCRLDTYMTQGTFTQPDRRAVHLAWMTHAYVDLDIYKSDAWSTDVDRDTYGARSGRYRTTTSCAGSSDECDDQDIPPPSVIVRRGAAIIRNGSGRRRSHARRRAALSPSIARSAAPL